MVFRVMPVAGLRGRDLHARQHGSGLVLHEAADLSCGLREEVDATEKKNNQNRKKSFHLEPPLEV